MQRKTQIFSASENVLIGLSEGNALLVQLTGTNFAGTVDLQTSVDGESYENVPYYNRSSLPIFLSVAQIVNPSLRTTYVVLPPLTQARIVVVVLAGSVKIVWREVLLPFGETGTSPTVAHYLGLSTDTKPSNPINGATFEETDTSYIYTFNQGQWKQRRSVRPESNLGGLMEEQIVILKQIRFGLATLVGVDLSEIQ